MEKIQMSSKQNQSQNPSENMRMYHSNSSLISSIFFMMVTGRHSKMMRVRTIRKNWKKRKKNTSSMRIIIMNTNHTIMDDRSNGWLTLRTLDISSKVLEWHLVSSSILLNMEMNMSQKRWNMHLSLGCEIQNDSRISCQKRSILI